MKISNHIKILYIIVGLQLIFLSLLTFSFLNTASKLKEFVISVRSHITKEFKNQDYSHVTRFDYDILIGSKEAPLTVFVFTQINCDFCLEFFNNQYQILKQDYIDKGKINLVVKFLNSEKSEYSNTMTKRYFCFSKFHSFDIVINEIQKHKTELDEKAFKNMLKVNNIDTLELNKYLYSDETNNQLAKIQTNATENGISATPSFIIDGKLFLGSGTFDDMQKYIDSKLNKMGTENFCK